MSFFDDAIAGITNSQVRATVVGYLQAANLKVTNWRVVSVGKQMFEGFVAASQAYVASQSVIVRGFASLETSTDPGDVDDYDPNNQDLPAAPGFLSAMGANLFGTTREEASFATGLCSFANAGPGARILAPGSVIWTWTEGTPPEPPPTYINTNDASIYLDGTVTVPAGTSIDLPVRCEVIGSIGSAPASSLSLTTTLVGCTSTNATAIVGNDREDAATYRRNCRQAPARLSLGGPADAYAYLAVKELDGTVLLNDSVPPVPTAITRVQVTQDSSTGIVDAYYASDSGAAIADDITAAVRNTKFNAMAVPDAITFTGYAAIPTIIHIEGSAKIKARIGITAQAVAEGIVASLVANGKTIPVGGVDQVANAGVVYTSDLEAFARAGYRGLYDVVVTTPAGLSTAIPSGHVPVLQSVAGDGLGSGDWFVTVVP
ncbi:MAG TPA: baseplate J/gp47 family protein [Polyangiaceae bacterium]|nr:baseplate J/gp47 family protein [Polyangiaceae bacterium]